MRLLALIGLFCCSVYAVQAQTINLDCGNMAGKLVSELDREGLLVPFGEAKKRAAAVAQRFCSQQQQTAQQQHEKDKQSFIKNWLTENTGGKAGNERLRNLKR